MLPDLLTALLRANLAAGVAILAAGALRGPVRRAFGAQAAYALWLVPALAAAAALAPPAAAPSLADPTPLQAGAAAGRAIRQGLDTRADLSALLAAVWAAGVGLTAAVLVRRQIRFLAGLGRLQAVGAGHYRAERPDVGPAVVGALRPRIVTPADFEARFTPLERDVILAHEARHLAVGDARINALAAALQCAFWFNPLVHLATRLMRIDQELACDAAVLRRFPGARRLYAEVLLKAQLAAQPLPLGCHWPAAGQHPLKERIAMLKSPLPARGRRLAGAALVAALSVGGACAAWAAATPAAGLITAPVWLQRPTGEDIRRVWPKGAEGQPGRATMTCRVDGDGRLERCAVVSQVPEAGGFGQAVLDLAPSFRMADRDPDGVSVQGREVRIPVRFSP